ncbi:MAG: Gfo/Idh/MocA family oxidoreductase [Candidatus Latescibacteria bacterium]|jgi:predicted dehydrogenase|nr:Gfo/Idh/MocA family oxidoreductase [Candidatus Latescibacterota bacterium]
MNDLSYRRPRICLLGCGTIGALHAKNLRWRSELYFCSRSRVSAHKFNTRFKGRGIFDDLDAVLESDVDAVVIASPPEHHKDQIIAVLQAGKAVLVEKPMCTSAEEVAAVERVLEDVEDPLLMVAENYYYKPSLAYLKHQIASGEIGRLRSVSVRKLTTQNALGWKSVYGALLEGGVHFVALINDLFDTSPEQVEAIFPDHKVGKNERHSVVRMVYADNVVAELEYSWQTPCMTKGIFQHSYLEGDGGRITFESNGIYILPRLVFPGLKDLMGYAAMTADFMACLRNRSLQPYSNFARAKRDLNVVFAAYGDLEN